MSVLYKFWLIFSFSLLARIKIHLIYLQICSMSVHMTFNIGVLDYAVRLRKNSCHMCSPRSYSARSWSMSSDSIRQRQKEKKNQRRRQCIVQLSWLRSGMDGESFYVPGWDSIPLEIKIGLQPFPNTWSMFSQYFRSSGEKTKSRSRICKPSELVLIGEEISRNVNVVPLRLKWW